jgi:hypothetical protein
MIICKRVFSRVSQQLKLCQVLHWKKSLPNKFAPSIPMLYTVHVCRKLVSLYKSVLPLVYIFISNQILACITSAFRDNLSWMFKAFQHFSKHCNTLQHLTQLIPPWKPMLHVKLQLWKPKDKNFWHVLIIILIHFKQFTMNSVGTPVFYYTLHIITYSGISLFCIKIMLVISHKNCH